VHHKILVNSIGASLLRTDQAAPVGLSPECSPGLVDKGGSLVREANETGEESDDSTAVPTASEELDGRFVLHLSSGLLLITLHVVFSKTVISCIFLY